MDCLTFSHDDPNSCPFSPRALNPINEIFPVPSLAPNTLWNSDSDTDENTEKTPEKIAEEHTSIHKLSKPIDNHHAFKEVMQRQKLSKRQKRRLAKRQKRNVRKGRAGVCDEIEPLKEPFDAERYMGLWYEINNTRGIPYQPDWFNCITAEYSNLDLDAGTFDIRNTGQWYRSPRFGIKGKGSIDGTPNGQASVAFFGADFGPPGYLIMETDYDSYSMIYSCNNGN